MKKRIIPYRKICFLFAILSINIYDYANITHQLNFDITKLSIKTDTINGQYYSELVYDGLGEFGPAGSPNIPYSIIRLSVPYGAKDFQITATSTGTQTTLQVTNPLIPIQQHYDICETPVFTIPDPRIYQFSEIYPYKLANLVSDDYYMGDNHIITIAVPCCTYNPLSNKVFFHSQISLLITYNSGDVIMGMAPLSRNGVELYKKGIRSTELIVENPSQVEIFAPQIGPRVDPGTEPEPGGGSATSGEEGEDPDPYFPYLHRKYNLITTASLAPAFKRLIAYKRQKGYTVVTTLMDSILCDSRYNQGDVFRDVNGNIISCIQDSAGILRQYLKQSFIDSTEFVLLGGDMSHVPVRYGYKFCLHDTIPPGHSSYYTPSDWYYCDLTTDWRNHKPWSNIGYTITSGTNFDFNPELYVGRIPARNSEDIYNYTDKLLRYELNPGNGDYLYLKRALYTQTDFMKIRHFGDSAALQMSPIFPIYSVISDIAYNYPSGSMLIDDINLNRYSYMNFHTHGAPVGVDATHWSGYYSRMVTAQDSNPCFAAEDGNGLDNLTNKLYPCVAYSMACKTMPIDNYGRKATLPINFGESFVLGKNYGGVAYLGNARDGSNWTYKIEKPFHESILAGHWKLGVAEAESKMGFLNGCDWEKLTHNLFGEPEFDMWTDMPTELSGIQVVRYNDSIVVMGIPSQDCIISICSNDNHQGLVSTPYTFYIFDGVSPNSTVMAYQHNCIPYIAPLYLQNIEINNSQYVFASSLVAGNSIDANRTSGNVTIKSGVEYEVEASGKIVLQGGFKVEQGALLKMFPKKY